MDDPNNKKLVYVVCCVDTEGPLSESIQATFERLNSILEIDLEPSLDNLKKIQNKELDLGGKEDHAARIFAPHLLDYKNTWEKLDEMLIKIMSNEFRSQLLDSLSGKWIFNWHCVDHVGYVENPRCRDLGHHKIFDHYQKMITNTNSVQDAVHWHFHPMSFYHQAHKCGTSFVNSPQLHEVLCRKIIEKQWFPKVFRAGFHVERPDINLFLEQWIPFDISNISIKNSSNKEQSDLSFGRFGDWRFAPDDWSIYHPSHDNYQISGNCRRSIARVLNLNTRHANIDQQEVDKAFERANCGTPTFLGITTHDYRNMESEIIDFQKMLIKAKEKFPDVKFIFSEAVNAFRNVLYGENHNFEKLKLEVSVKKNNNSWKLEVNVKQGSIFGPQPYLAIKTKSDRFIHENFDLVTLEKTWAYTFDDESIKPKDVSVIGIASNDRYGNTAIEVINVT